MIFFNHFIINNNNFNVLRKNHYQLKSELILQLGMALFFHLKKIIMYLKASNGGPILELK
jgi:hypothetical protein